MYISWQGDGDNIDREIGGGADGIKIDINYSSVSGKDSM